MGWGGWGVGTGLLVPAENCSLALLQNREVLHGVGVKFQIFAVNCCSLPLSLRRSREKRRKRGKMRKKRKNA